LAICLSAKRYTLIFEDDASPKDNEWLETITEAISLLSYFDVVSFHGRQWDLKAFQLVHENPKYIFPKKEYDPWIVAALAYLVDKENPKIQKLLDRVYDGMPYDLLLYKSLSYCLRIETPFIHDRSEGTLIEP
jgi:hypothetical protein